MTAVSRCPDHATWVRLVNEEVQEPENSVLNQHLERCDACCTVVDELFGDWNPRKPVDADKSTLNASIQKMLVEVAEHPDRLAPSRKTVPQQPPEIPGLTHFQPVGQGGMGLVYRAVETSLNRDVAVKVLSFRGLNTPSSRQRAEREAMTLARLRHPNVVQIHRTGEANGQPYMVMEWIPGGTLQAQIDLHMMPHQQAAAIVRDLALAIGEAHALGIVHRDIKPDNVLMMPAGTAGKPSIPKLADFGLARSFEGPPGVTDVGQVVGTPSYMAPEQTGLSPELGEVGPATDIHGLGATLYALVSGRPPYDGQTSRESLQRAGLGEARPLATLCIELPIDLKTIIEKCLQHSPLKRYRSAGELADDLTRFLDGKPILARPISTAERLLKWARRKPLAAVAATLTTLGIVAGIAGVAYYQNQLNQKIVDLERARNLEKRAHDGSRLVVMQTTEYRERAHDALEILTSDTARRLHAHTGPLDADDRALLCKIREQYQQWPPEPDAENAFPYRAAGLRRIAAIFAHFEQFEDTSTCLQDVIVTHNEAESEGLVLPQFSKTRAQDEQALQDLLDKMSPAD